MAMNSIDPLSRRGFLKGSAVLGGGLVVAFVIPGAHRFALGAENQGNVFAPNAFLRIGNDNSVTVLLGHSEMGQGIWTGLTMLIAEELDADWSKIRVEHSPASAADYGLAGFGGMQITGGSTSTWMEFDRYRQAGAAARLLLVEAAAKRFNVAPSAIRTESGVVIAGDQHATYGELADDAGKLPVPDPASIKLKEAKDWKIIGKPTKRLDTPEKITGRAKFGMDVQFDGLMTAMVARSPVFGGSVKSFEGAEALAIPGVHKVVQVPTGVAVIADHYWAAKLGRDALHVEWDLGPNTGLDSEQLLEDFRKLAATPGLPASQAGDTQAALAKAIKTLDVEYSVPYLAHAPMEPLNCTVKHHPGQMRDLDRYAVPDPGPDDRRQNHRAQTRAGRDPHRVPRRRFWPASQPDLGLCRRSGPGRQSRGWAGENRVGAGGRHPWRLLSLGVPASGARRPGR